tara:strand:+ start:6900 stop:7256 length:357 start_codon:yes stop_codon:yes gene_type:complete
MYLTGPLSFLLFLSCLGNLLAVWFIRKLINQQKEMVVDLQDLITSANNFENHVNSLHELEMFYGDTTLQALIDHSREVADDFEDYMYKYSFLEGQKTELNEEDNIDEQYQTEKNETPP